MITWAMRTPLLLACSAGFLLTGCGAQPAPSEGTPLAARVEASCGGQRAINVAPIDKYGGGTASVLVVCNDGTVAEVHR